MPERHLIPLTDPGPYYPPIEPATQPVGLGNRRDGSRQPRVLLVDDDDALLEAVAAYLSRRGYEVCRAESLEGAAAFLARLRFSAVVTDLHLTDGMDADGLELCQHVRAHHPEARIVVLTGVVDGGVEREASRLGLHAVVFKPCPVQRLGKVLDELTHHNRGGRLTHDAGAACGIHSPHPIVTAQGYQGRVQ